MITVGCIYLRDLGTGPTEFGSVHVPDNAEAARERIDKALKNFQQSLSITGVCEASIVSVLPRLYEGQIVIIFSQYSDTLGEKNDDLTRVKAIIVRAAANESENGEL